MKKKQMMAKDTSKASASSAPSSWETIDWRLVKARVHRLQMRIAKAYREGRFSKAKALQWLLTHSHHAKLLAVKRVSGNPGKNTPGVDQVIWRSPNQKMKAALSLKRRGYKAQPLRRVYIPKKEGQKRPLSIPVMKCRAMQALYLMALEPIAEMKANLNSYGFRPKRSAADAIAQCFIVLARKVSAPWVLEADIHDCFNKISHSWLHQNVPMDTKILKKWLTAGYVDQNAFYLAPEGTPQGGIISPVLLNIVLSGLEVAIHQAAPHPKDKVHVCIYADDFIVMGATKEVLEERVKPVVVSFLKERGLELSKEKTKISSIHEGVEFLGVCLRKYKGKYLPKPSKGSVKSFLYDIRTTIKSHPSAKTENLIHLLNPKIRGWSQYFRNVCSKKTFSYLDHHLFRSLWRWALKRHPKKGAKWLKKKYFRSHKNQNWIFSSKSPGRTGACLDLITASSVTIKRHIKVRADATPYNPAFNAYFQTRKGMERA